MYCAVRLVMALFLLLLLLLLLQSSTARLEHLELKGQLARRLKKIKGTKKYFRALESFFLIILLKALVYFVIQYRYLRPNENLRISILDRCGLSRPLKSKDWDCSSGPF